jgi:cytochrome c-type biogenesis protein CcmI
MMVRFCLIACAMLLTALLCVILPLLRRAAEHANGIAGHDGHALAVAIYRVELLEVEREFAAGHLSPQHRAGALHELERRLIKSEGAGIGGLSGARPARLPHGDRLLGAVGGSGGHGLGDWSTGASGYRASA